MPIQPKKIAINKKRVEEFMKQLISGLKLRSDAPIQAFDVGNGSVIEVQPGELIPPEVLKKYRIDQSLLHPDSLRNKHSFEFAHKHKKQFSVGIIRDMNGKGDVILASVIAKALKYQYGDDVIIYYCVKPGYERILQHNPWVDKIVTDREELRALEPDIKYQVNDLELRAELREFKELGAVYRSRSTIYLHNMDLKHLENKSPYYFVTEEERQWAKEELKKLGLKHKLIGISLFGSNITRTYPHMRKVGELLQQRGYRIIYLDEKEGDKFKYDLAQMAALIEQCNVTVCSNTLAYHLAGAMRCRATAIFGSCDGYVWTEDYEKVNVVQIGCPESVGSDKCWWKLTCLPGDSLREKEQTWTPKCLSAITPETVVEKVEEHFQVKKVLVVVLTYELLDLTKQMIDSVRSFHSYDIMAIDNDSKDSTRDYLKSKGIECIIQKGTVPDAWNRGMLEGYNRGYDYVLLCNNDIVLASNYIDTAIEVADRRQAIAVTGKVINKNECEQAEFPYRIEPVEYPVTTMVAGDYSALLVSRQCIEEIGAFKIFGKRYQADEDHLLRIRLSGHELVKTHTSTFYHLLGAVVHSIPKEKEDKEADWQRGLEEFKKEWNVDPYSGRFELNSLENMKLKNPNWKSKIKKKIIGIKE